MEESSTLLNKENWGVLLLIIVDLIRNTCCLIFLFNKNHINFLSKPFSDMKKYILKKLHKYYTPFLTYIRT